SRLCTDQSEWVWTGPFIFGSVFDRQPAGLLQPLPPPSFPPHKGEGGACLGLQAPSSPSPLWGGTKGGGGNHSRPLNPKNPHLNTIRPPESRGYRPCRDARRTGSTAGGTGRSIH